MGEDPEAPNYDPAHKIIRSMENGSRGPMLRKATALDWVGDPFDVKSFDRRARRVDVRAVPRALPGVRRRRRRSLPEPGRHDAADERVPAGRRAEIQEVAGGVHGRLARSDEAERRHHSQLRRSGRQDRRARRHVVEERLRLGIQPRQSGDRQARRSQPDSARARRVQQRAARHRRSEVRRRLADDDRCRELTRARDRRTQAVSDDVRRRGLVRLAERPLERRRAGGLVLVAEAAGPRAGSVATRLARIPARAESGVSRAGAAARSQR